MVRKCPQQIKSYWSKKLIQEIDTDYHLYNYTDNAQPYKSKLMSHYLGHLA